LQSLRARFSIEWIMVGRRRDYNRLMLRRIAYLFSLTTALTLAAQAQPNDCNTPAASPSVTISLPSAPFMVLPSRDGCFVFVSLTGNAAARGIAVLKRMNGKVELARVVPLDSAPTGITLTHDGKLLIAAATNATVFLDVQKMIEGAANPVAGSFGDGGSTSSIYANVTSDDKLLFVSEESAASIAVIDLERARKSGYTPDTIIGKIPVGRAPIALTFSPDGKWLYTTSQVALPDWKWPIACKPEGRGGPGAIVTNPEGAVVVVDVARAKTDSAHSRHGT
jgi:DNA-binding beta-propeller fold protein YncE